MFSTPSYPADSSRETAVPVEPLKELLVKMYVKMGMFKAEAEIAASRQVESDMRGIPSHGVRATPRYLKAMQSGDIDPRGQTTTVVDMPALAVLDGGRNIGHVCATRAMKLAIAKAKEVGTGTVVVKNSLHYGASGVSALMAAEQGMIGFTTTSTGGATVAAYGSTKAGTANNAFAWAAPTRTGKPFCLDMACAQSSWGKVDAWKMYGRTMPGDWALTADGQPTTDPNQAKILLPAAGARGSALALVCAFLTGPLVGGKMPLHKTRHPDQEDSEHFFYVIDVARCGFAERFYEELDSTLEELRQFPPAEGFDRVTVAGDLQTEQFLRAKEHGVILHADDLKALGECAAKWKLPVPWEPAA